MHLSTHWHFGSSLSLPSNTGIFLQETETSLCIRIREDQFFLKKSDWGWLSWIFGKSLQIQGTEQKFYVDKNSLIEKIIEMKSTQYQKNALENETLYRISEIFGRIVWKKAQKSLIMHPNFHSPSELYSPPQTPLQGTASFYIPPEQIQARINQKILRGTTPSISNIFSS